MADSLRSFVRTRSVITPLARHRWLKCFTPYVCANGMCSVFFDPKTKRYFDGARMDQGDKWLEEAPPCIP